MRRILVLVLAIAVLSTGLNSFLSADDKAPPKYTIKDVMAKAHKEGLYKKVAAGTATKEDKDMLVEYYEALPGNKPPRGDEKAWKTKTETLVKDAKAVAEGKKDAVKALAKSANCMACHNVHQPKR